MVRRLQIINDQDLPAVKLNKAVYNGQHELVCGLVNKYPELASKISALGRTHVHWAAFLGYQDLVKMLREKHPASVRIRDCYHKTPYMYAMEHGYLAVCVELVGSGSEKFLQAILNDEQTSSLPTELANLICEFTGSLFGDAKADRDERNIRQPNALKLIAVP